MYRLQFVFSLLELIFFFFSFLQLILTIICNMVLVCIDIDIKNNTLFEQKEKKYLSG